MDKTFIEDIGFVASIWNFRKTGEATLTTVNSVTTTTDTKYDRNYKRNPETWNSVNTVIEEFSDPVVQSEWDKNMWVT